MCFKIQVKQSGNDPKRFHDESTAINDKIFKKNCITPTQHLKSKWTFSLINVYLSQKYSLDRLIAKCDCIRFTPSSINFLIREQNQILIDILKEGAKEE